MLEHEAQIFGFLEKEFPEELMASPQQIQIRGFIPCRPDLSSNFAPPLCPSQAACHKSAWGLHPVWLALHRVVTIPSKLIPERHAKCGG
jgi:hypothetical protein